LLGLRVVRFRIEGCEGSVLGGRPEGNVVRVQGSQVQSFEGDLFRLKVFSASELRVIRILFRVEG
jgi:hypothetical protein